MAEVMSRPGKSDAGWQGRATKRIQRKEAIRSEHEVSQHERMTVCKDVAQWGSSFDGADSLALGTKTWLTFSTPVADLASQEEPPTKRRPSE